MISTVVYHNLNMSWNHVLLKYMYMYSMNLLGMASFIATAQKSLNVCISLYGKCIDKMRHGL